MTAFPVEPEAITAQWLTAVLSDHGILDAGASVIDFAWRRVGTGQVGDSVRLELRYAGGTGPSTLVIKLPSPDPTSRMTASAFQLYRKEVGFYQDIAERIEVRVPKVLAARLSADGSEFLLLFEDLGPARGGNQLDGCTLADARAAVSQAAALHSGTRGAAVLGADWLQPRADLSGQLLALYPRAQAIFRERYGDVLEPESMAICEDLAVNAKLWFARQPVDPCLIHGDFRLDNMLFDIRDGKEPIAVLDWQTVAVGNGLTDIGYFLGCGIGSALRRPHEAELLALYADEMARHGVRLDRDAMFDQYRVGALHGVATAVFSSANVVRTERGDANFLSMARGACELARDHDSLGVLRRCAA